MPMLKLAALDAEDLAVLSSQIQDAVVKVGAVNWIQSEGRIVMSMHRFAWEEALQKRGFFGPKPTYERHQAVLHFDRVTSVKARNIRMDAKEAVLNMLAITFEQNEEGPDGYVSIIFAGDAELRIGVECIEAQLTDTGGAWETENLPEHEAAETFDPNMQTG
ncbi:DUF2948 family protein [Cohaesibacter celericrescens]|uniref:DUF2948 domain-containing protein n=1 Tax=Cohaesibacter celericrescens TaxID=2067669 RepID=A0A2N5XX21_9HYPH|nr:DUF2948 family protein [Cohaesibacter celericrescens]PLW79053.1 DUF2948 domain-containing protein [Cohaesibacter celericrescens]